MYFYFKAIKEAKKMFPECNDSEVFIGYAISDWKVWLEIFVIDGIILFFILKYTCH